MSHTSILQEDDSGLINFLNHLEAVPS